MPFCGLSLFLVNCKNVNMRNLRLEQSSFVSLSVNEGLIFPPKIARTDPEQWADVAADVGSRAAAIQAVSTLPPFLSKRETRSLDDKEERAWDRFWICWYFLNFVIILAGSGRNIGHSYCAWWNSSCSLKETWKKKFTKKEKTPRRY